MSRTTTSSTRSIACSTGSMSPRGPQTDGSLILTTLGHALPETTLPETELSTARPSTCATTARG
eukprot:8291969-Alexandrium_andersonii.AAC.1